MMVNAFQIPIDDVTVKPGDTWVSGGELCTVLAVYQEGWQSLTIIPSRIDTCLIIKGHRLFNMDVKTVQELVLLQRRMEASPTDPLMWLTR